MTIQQAGLRHVALALVLISCAPSASPAASETGSASAAAAASATAATPTAVASVNPTPQPTATPAESAGAFWTRQIEMSFRHEWAARWDELLAVHQAVVTKERYVRCSLVSQQLSGTPQVKVVSTTEEVYVQPNAGLLLPQQTAAVTIDLSVPGQPENTRTFTTHAWNVGGKWRWALNADDYQAYKTGSGCPQ